MLEQLSSLKNGMTRIEVLASSATLLGAADSSQDDLLKQLESIGMGPADIDPMKSKAKPVECVSERAGIAGVDQLDKRLATLENAIGAGDGMDEVSTAQCRAADTTDDSMASSGIRVAAANPPNPCQARATRRRPLTATPNRSRLTPCQASACRP
jgi:hypothetical protein